MNFLSYLTIFKAHLAYWLIGLVMSLIALTTLAQPQPFNTDNDAIIQRYHRLISEIRCPVCQGQSIQDSNAPLAQDLKTQVASMMQQNKTNDEIKAYLIERYGDFIVFEPPMHPKTLLLWFTPVIFVLFALIMLIRSLHKRYRSQKNL